MTSLMKLPEWHPVGFKEVDGKECPLFKCVTCEENCKFVIEGGARLPDMCTKRGSKIKLTNHRPEGEPPNEKEAFLIKTILERGAL